MKKIFLLIVGIFITNANAQYIDPGAGSYILQILIAGFLAFLFYYRQILTAIKTFYNKRFRKDHEK